MRLIQLPVKRSKLFEETLQKLGGQGGQFNTLREALTFCAVLGYKERRRLPLDKNAGTEDIAGAQYQTNDAVDIMFALALAERKETDILRPENDQDSIQIYEEYANGGLDLVQSWLDRYADSSVEDAIMRGLKTIGVSPPNTPNAQQGVVEPDI